MFSAFWAILPVFGVSDYVLEGALTSCSLDWTNKSMASFIYVICLFVFVYVLPLSQIIYCNCQTIQIVCIFAWESFFIWNSSKCMHIFWFVYFKSFKDSFVKNQNDDFQSDHFSEQTYRDGKASQGFAHYTRARLLVHVDAIRNDINLHSIHWCKRSAAGIQCHSKPTHQVVHVLDVFLSHHIE